MIAVAVGVADGDARRRRQSAGGRPGWMRKRNEPAIKTSRIEISR